MRSLQWAGYLHDLGKIAVPDGVLLKPGPLTAEERVIINRHPEAGADLVRGLHTLDDVRPIIRHHHERWDGSGYPDRLAGEAIPLGARIMAVMDVFDALHTTRPYKKSMARRRGAGYPAPGSRRGLLGAAHRLHLRRPRTDRPGEGGAAGLTASR